MVFVNACSPSYQIKGQVVDLTGVPLSNVDVTTEPMTRIVTTDQEGNFTIDWRFKQRGEEEETYPIKPGHYKVKMTRDGFKTLDVLIEAVNTDGGLRVYVMHKVEESSAPMSPSSSISSGLGDIIRGSKDK